MFTDLPTYDPETPPSVQTLGTTYNDLLASAQSLESVARQLAAALRRYADPLPGVKPSAKDATFARQALAQFTSLLA